MKKRIALLLIWTYVFVLAGCRTDSVIGTIGGAENEYITIDDVTYIKADLHDLSRKDRGAYLGNVANANITMGVYSVKGDENGDFLYALWDWEGEFYVRQEEELLYVYE